MLTITTSIIITKFTGQKLFLREIHKLEQATRHCDKTETKYYKWLNQLFAPENSFDMMQTKTNELFSFCFYCDN